MNFIFNEQFYQKRFFIFAFLFLPFSIENCVGGGRVLICAMNIFNFNFSPLHNSHSHANSPGEKNNAGNSESNESVCMKMLHYSLDAPMILYIVYIVFCSLPLRSFRLFLISSVSMRQYIRKVYAKFRNK